MTKRSKWAESLILYKIQLTHKQSLIRSSITLIFLFIIPIIIVTLPENYFDTGKSICLSKLILNQECYACGLTRACLHLINLNFEKAFEYNMGSFIIFPLLCILWIFWIFQERKKISRLLELKKVKN